MQLKEFALINPSVEAKEVFQALKIAITPEVIDQALEKSARFEKRQRKLPASLVVCLVIAMSLWSSDSMGTVLKNLVNGLNRQWTKLGQYWKTPNSSSITAARQKLGCQVMSRLFDSIVKPLATPETPGAFLGGLRVMAVDGTVLDVPDSKANAKVFGYPGSRKGTRAAFPKVRVVLLIEAPNTFNYRCSDVSLSNGRKSQSLKTIAFGNRINAVDVGCPDYILIVWSMRQ